MLRTFVVVLPDSATDSASILANPAALIAAAIRSASTYVPAAVNETVFAVAKAA